MMHAAIRRSDVAAGLVGAITFPDGVIGLDVLGDDRRVRWAGQPIAVVAAESPAEASSSTPRRASTRTPRRTR